MNSTLRLTRRGRAVILLTLVSLLFVAFLAGRTGAEAASDSPASTPYASTTVQPGETLWAVAKRVAPGHDPRATVDKLRELNHLTGGNVLAGQQLLLPHAS